MTDAIKAKLVTATNPKKIAALKAQLKAVKKIIAIKKKLANASDEQKEKLLKKLDTARASLAKATKKV